MIRPVPFSIGSGVHDAMLKLGIDGRFSGVALDVAAAAVSWRFVQFRTTLVTAGPCTGEAR